MSKVAKALLALGVLATFLNAPYSLASDAASCTTMAGAPCPTAPSPAKPIGPLMDPEPPMEDLLDARPSMADRLETERMRRFEDAKERVLDNLVDASLFYRCGVVEEITLHSVYTKTISLLSAVHVQFGVFDAPKWNEVLDDAVRRGRRMSQEPGACKALEEDMSWTYSRKRYLEALQRMF